SLADALRIGPGEEDRRRLRDMARVRRTAEERNRPLAEDRPDEPSFAHGPRSFREPPHRARALARVRVPARAGRPALAVDPELRLLRVVAEQREFLETRLEPERPERSRDGLGRARRRLGAALTRSDRREGLEEVHRASL